MPSGSGWDLRPWDSAAATVGSGLEQGWKDTPGMPRLFFSEEGLGLCGLRVCLHQRGRPRPWESLQSCECDRWARAGARAWGLKQPWEPLGVLQHKPWAGRGAHTSSRAGEKAKEAKQKKKRGKLRRKFALRVSEHWTVLPGGCGVSFCADSQNLHGHCSPGQPHGGGPAVTEGVGEMISRSSVVLQV